MFWIEISVGPAIELLNFKCKKYIQLYGKWVLCFHSQMGLQMLQTAEQRKKSGPIQDVTKVGHRRYIEETV
jgi:hypothetical protein